MRQFIRNHQADVVGVLSGFDRNRFPSTRSEFNRKRAERVGYFL